MIPDSFLALLQQLEQTHSPGVKIGYLYEFFASEGVDLKDARIQAVLNTYKASGEAKRAQGSKGGTTTSQTKANVKHKAGKASNSKTFDRPFFVTDYKGGSCVTCQAFISSNAAFRWKKDGTYQDYHCLPECFPAEHHHLFTGNKNYNQWQMPHTENHHDQEEQE